MSQLTIYLDSETQKKVQAAAQRESVSLSRWARTHLAQAADAASASAWDHLAEFSGAADESFAPPARNPQQREVPPL